LNIGRLEVGGAKVVLWDLGGAASLRSIWDKYFAEAHVLLCVASAVAFPYRFPFRFPFRSFCAC
jgi:hypothetical protein